MILKLKNIYKTYKNERETINIFNGFNLNIAEGETIAVTGASGSGKTTLLNIIAGITEVDSGDIIFNGKNITKFNAEQMAKLRLNEIGIIFQDHHLLPQCTALENALLPTLPFNKAESSKPYAEKLFKILGLESRMNHFPAQMSGGECQRTAVIRALINKPKILLADEPTGNLDKTIKKELLDTLTYINQQFNTTILMVTHSDSAAAYMKNQITIGN